MCVLPAPPSQSGQGVFRLMNRTEANFLLDIYTSVLKPSSDKIPLRLEALLNSPFLSSQVIDVSGGSKITFSVVKAKARIKVANNFDLASEGITEVGSRSHDSL